MDEDLRGRFRRDFTNEPIKSGQPAPPQPVNPPPQQPPQPVPQPLPQSSSRPPAAPDDPFKDLKPLESQPHQLAKAKKKRRRSYKKFFIVLIILLAVGFTALGIYSYTQGTVPKKVIKESSIPILYPDKLPPGYTINKTSFNVSGNNLITYYAQNSAGDHIIFTVQPKSPNFDYQKFYDQSLQDSTKFSTSLGSGAVGTAQGHLLGMLTTDKTWIIVAGNNKNVDSSKVQLVLKNLKQTE
jgi:hypothetical protein